KEYKKTDKNTDEMIIETLFREWNALKASFPSHYIVSPVGYCQHPPAIVMEYVEKGALDIILTRESNPFACFLHEEPLLTFNQLMVIANDIALGLLKLLEVNLVHRDIKTANILITKNKRAK